MGFTQYFYIGQCLVVNFTHLALLCLVEASKFHQIVYYVLPNTRSIPTINNKLDPMTVLPFEVDHQALNFSRNRNLAIHTG